MFGQRKLVAIALVGCLVVTNACTIGGAAAGPFIGLLKGGEEFVSWLGDDRFNAVEKTGMVFALPGMLVGGVAWGTAMGPFVGFSADVELITTGSINIDAYKSKYFGGILGDGDPDDGEE